jgi:hypothetical protein
VNDLGGSDDDDDSSAEEGSDNGAALTISCLSFPTRPLTNTAVRYSKQCRYRPQLLAQTSCSPYIYSSYRLSARLQRTAAKRFGMETRIAVPFAAAPREKYAFYLPSDFNSFPLLALPACSRFFDNTSSNMLDIATDTCIAYIQLLRLSSNPLNLRQLCPSQLSPPLHRVRTSPYLHRPPGLPCFPPRAPCSSRRAFLDLSRARRDR